MEKKNVLVIGANGQIGSELVLALMNEFNVIASDLPINGVSNNSNLQDEIKNKGLKFIDLDVTNVIAVEEAVKEFQVNQVYLLAAMVSGVAERKRVPSWNLNVGGLLNILEISLNNGIEKVYWPSSMAVYGPVDGKQLKVAQQTDPLFPVSIYGAAKVAGEQLCYYYANRKGLDVRSIRYPGLISTKTPGGGGTTDYAIDIFFSANKNEKFECFLKEDTRMEMMYMDDAINGTIQLMKYPKEKLTPGISYNLGAVDFTPCEIYEEIKKHKPSFEIIYNPDEENRQKNANSWPAKINDEKASQDWEWKPKYNSKELLTEIMLKNAYRTEKLMSE